MHMLRKSKPKDAPQAEAPRALGVKDVQFVDGFLRIEDLRFRLSDIIVASINNDTNPGDGVGGSALFKTREFEPDRGVVQKVYKATFDEKAIVSVNNLIEKIRGAGGSVTVHKLKDFSFRSAFF